MWVVLGLLGAPLEPPLGAFGALGQGEVEVSLLGEAVTPALIIVELSEGKRAVASVNELLEKACQGGINTAIREECVSSEIGLLPLRHQGTEEV